MNLSFKFVRCQKCVSDHFDTPWPARCLTVKLSNIILMQSWLHHRTDVTFGTYLWIITWLFTSVLAFKWIIQSSPDTDLKIQSQSATLYCWEFKFNYDNSEVLELSVSNCSREGGRVRMDGTIFTTKTLFKDWHWIIPISWASWNSRTFRLRHIAPNSFLNMSDEYVR